MPSSPQFSHEQQFRLLLAIDTCGPSGTVALGRFDGSALHILGHAELEGRTYSAMLVASVSELLKPHGLALRDLACLIAVSGPGSFTGVRVGLSTVKGLAEGADLPVVTVSRLEVLANKGGLPNAALDAHRHEVFLRVGLRDGLRIEGRELLAGAADLHAIEPAPERVAVCDDAAAALLAAAWPAANLVRVSPPTAADAMLFALPQVRAGNFADVALLDGHYLRRSDAEIFGETSGGTRAHGV